MKTLLLSALLLTSSLSAMSLSEIIDSSLNSSPSLASITANIEANKQTIEVANQFSNPELLITTNTLDNSQAMSQTVVTLKQKIPYYGKRDSKEQIALAQDEVLQEKFNQAKVTLVALIKEEAYNIWELQETYKIFDEYIELTKRNIELYESYTSVSDNQHMGIMKAELSLSDLAIAKSNIKAKIYASYARLSYLASKPVTNLELSLQMAEKPELSSFTNEMQNSPQLRIKEKELKREEAKIALASKENYPDFTLLAGYAYRENFDNYANIGLGITLPIYGTEDAKEEESRALALSTSSQKEDTKISIDSKLKIYYAQMQSSYEIYHIVQDDALPQVEHMFELSNSSISTGSDLFKYIDVLFQKLSLEQKSINAVSNYNKAQAKIAQLTGALQ